MMPDAGKPDAAKPDTGKPESATPDTGVPDTGAPDTEVPDTATPDAHAQSEVLFPLSGEQEELVFQRAFGIALALEGGYVNDPADRGGATNYGVTQATYNAFRDGIGRPEQSVRHITEWEARQIYRQMYWQAGGCGKLWGDMAVAHFDACIHHGPRQAVRFLQRIAGATEDGMFGGKTLAAITAALATAQGGTPTESGTLTQGGTLTGSSTLAQGNTLTQSHALVTAYLFARMGFYIDLVRRDASQGKFLKGWYNRLVRLGTELGVIRKPA